MHSGGLLAVVRHACRPTALPYSGDGTTRMRCLASGCLPARLARLTAWFTWLRFVDRYRPALEFFPLERLDGGVRRHTVGHLDKAKAFGVAGVAIRNDTDRVHHAIGLKELTQCRDRGGEGQIANINRHGHGRFLAGNGYRIAKSSEQYAGAHDARAICRRNGEEYSMLSQERSFISQNVRYIILHNSNCIKGIF